MIWHQRQKRIYSFTDEQIYFSKQKQRKFNCLKLSRFEKKKTQSKYLMHKIKFLQDFSQGISEENEFVYLEKNRFIFYAVKRVFV